MEITTDDELVEKGKRAMAATDGLNPFAWLRKSRLPFFILSVVLVLTKNLPYND